MKERERWDNILRVAEDVKVVWRRCPEKRPFGRLRTHRRAIFIVSLSSQGYDRLSWPSHLFSVCYSDDGPPVSRPSGRRWTRCQNCLSCEQMNGDGICRSEVISLFGIQGRGPNFLMDGFRLDTNRWIGRLQKESYGYKVASFLDWLTQLVFLFGSCVLPLDHNLLWINK